MHPQILLKHYSTAKTYPALKTFFHDAYNRRLNAIDLQNTTGALGYTPAHNIYNVLDFGNDDDSTAANSIGTTGQPTPGVGTEGISSIGAGASMANSAVHPGIMAAINQSIAPAFNQVVQNQSALQMQIAALSVAQAHRRPTAAAIPSYRTPVPRIRQGHVPPRRTRGPIVPQRPWISRWPPGPWRRKGKRTSASSHFCDDDTARGCRILRAEWPICSP